MGVFNQEVDISMIQKATKNNKNNHIIWATFLGGFSPFRIVYCDLSVLTRVCVFDC